MATLSVKPTNRYALTDWFTSNNNISTNSERQRDESHDIRQETRGLINVTTNKTKWDQHDNHTRLDDRIWDVSRWKIALERTLNDINKGINNLDQSKLTTELSLEEKGVWLDVAIECLTLRESRRDIDVVKDYVEDELHKEVEVINKVKSMLQKRISEAFAQLSTMREARHQVVHDLEDKSETLNIDDSCLTMNNNSSRISYKPNPTRVLKNSTTSESWFQFSRYNKERADNEVRAGIRMQEIIDDTLCMARNELEAQRIATEFGYRKRLHEQERAKGELEWQELKTKEEIEEIEEDIRRLEESIRHKQTFLKVAHTRLEDRTYRPNVELCRDNPQYGITEEVRQLEGTIARLKEKLAQDHNTRYKLYQQLYRIQEDLACKKNSIALDNKCMDLRRKLTVPAQEYVSKPPVNESTRTQDRDSTPNHPVKTEFLSASYKTVP